MAAVWVLLIYSVVVSVAAITGSNDALFRSSCVALLGDAQLQSPLSELTEIKTLALLWRDLQIPIVTIQLSKNLHGRSEDIQFPLFHTYRFTDSKYLKIYGKMELIGTTWIIYKLHKETKHKYHCKLNNIILLVSERKNINGKFIHGVKNVYVNSSFDFFYQNDSINNHSPGGLSLLATAVEYPPFNSINSLWNGNIELSGFFISVWRLLEDQLNFTTCLRRSGSFGKLEDGVWNGAISLLHQEKVDACVCEMTVTSLRSNFVDFTFPLISSRATVFLRLRQESILRWSDEALDPFSRTLWLQLVVVVIGVSIFLCLLQRLLQSWGPSQRDGDRFTLLESIFCIFGIFCQQASQPGRSDASCCRVVVLVSHLTATIILAAYSANLVAALAARNPPPPASTFEDLLSQPSLRLGMLKDSRLLNYFDFSSSPLMHRVYESLIKDERARLPRSDPEGFAAVCRRTDFGYMALPESLGAVVTRLPCALAEVRGAAVPENMAFALRKDSPYRHLFNLKLLRLRELGIISREKLRLWPRRKEAEMEFLESVDLPVVIPCILVLLSGTLVAICLCIMEIVFMHLLRRFSRRSPLSFVYTIGTNQPFF